MIDAGIFGDARCELLEGLVVEKVTHNPPHDAAISLIQNQLIRRLPSQWLLRVQSSIALEDSQPEPDLVVARGPERRYSDHHPYPREIGLTIEVADTTLAQDRVEKQRIYVAARIPVYWVVNLIDRQVEVFAGPSAAGTPHYKKHDEFREGTRVPVVLKGVEVGRLAVRDMLP
jgi:hypothetical protein